MKYESHNNVEKGRGPLARLSSLYPFIVLIGLYKFTTSFFLAKKSMSQISQCQNDTASTLLKNELGLTDANIEYLYEYGILSKHQVDENGITSSSNGCWMPRRVDSIAIIVIDALRFDFALQHLPKSVGGRLSLYQDPNAKHNLDVNNNEEKNGGNDKVLADNNTSRGQSQLFRFIADPPTVTMQRLKGLTTGGLPTFADISGSFGGANVDEDSWVQQLYDVPIARRGLAHLQKNDMRVAVTGFVGDDTWIDLFPNQFHDSHPYPSFNTRDLDTVDNGCLQHLPRLLKSFGSSSLKTMDKFFELIIVHFLGVDHVGHTYGPNTAQMDAKFSQMDDVLENVLGRIDNTTDKCQVAFVFGDHGMTDDGNHGGGTKEETNAGLFAHFSPGCGDMGPSLDISGEEIGSYSQEAFRTVNQIDWVPTMSFLLGLPIPFANLGGVIPGLLPPLHYHSEDTIVEAPYIATALALNAAQVWNYLDTYSSTANKLPENALSELKELFENASSRFKEALRQHDGLDSNAYREACGLFKYFLAQATDLGKQVWTRFDTTGMGIGIAFLIVALLLGNPLLSSQCDRHSFMNSLKKTPKTKVQRFLLGSTVVELLSLVAVISFHCVVLTFSNSYIITEEKIIMYILSLMCLMTTVLQFLKLNILSSDSTRLHVDSRRHFYPILVPLCSRLHQLFVSGHGQDPMIRKHWAHHNYVFITSLVILGLMRFIYFSKWTSSLQLSKIHTTMDIATIVLLSVSWVDKRALEPERHGYLSSRLALLLCTFGFIILCIQWSWTRAKTHTAKENTVNNYLHKTLMAVIKILLFTIAVTGPSSATSCVLVVVQVYALSKVTFANDETMRGAPILAAMWRLAIRHAFYVTGHECSFNKLQFSAAFVATETFYFISAGASLFLNTFGWDLLGIVLVATISRVANRPNVWKYFCFYQVVETVFSCISVTMMRRHLMVWAIFAPRYVFATIFLGLCMAYFLFDKYIIGYYTYDEKMKGGEPNKVL